MRDIHNNIEVVQAIDASALKADNTPAEVDLQGFGAAEIVLQIGAGGITFTGTNKIEFKLTHSDDDATYAAVDLGDVQGVGSVGTGGIIKSLTAEHAAATVTQIGYVGEKRYLKLLADFSGTHATETPIAAVVVKGLPGDEA